MSLEAAISTPEGEFIKDAISGTVKFAKAQMGGKFFTCLLEDGQYAANLSCDKDLFTRYEGQRVTFAIAGRGKGNFLKRKPNYNGKPQIALGEFIQVTPAGQQTPVQQNSKETQAYPTRTENTGQTVTVKSGMTAEEMAATWATLAAETVTAFTREGFSTEHAETAALKAPEWAALWWFGEKSVRVGKATERTISTDEDIPF